VGITCWWCPPGLIGREDHFGQWEGEDGWALKLAIFIKISSFL